MACWKPSLMTENVHLRTGVVFYKFEKYLPAQSSYSPWYKTLRSYPVRCYQCSGCRAKDSRDWAIRAYHENIIHESSCFVTLTVENKFMETVFPGGSVRYEPFQKWIRSLRKKLKKRLRFFMCAEYGDKFERPHYHSILFGWNPICDNRGDTEIIKRSNGKSGHLYASRILSDTWSYGFNSVGSFDIGCAFYVTGYIYKKISGRLRDSWYEGRAQEFAHMSLKPGLGEPFYQKYTSDMYRKDCVTLPGNKKFPIPRFYDKKHAFYHPYHMEAVRRERLVPDPVRDRENTPERLAVRKVIHERRLKDKRRLYETRGDL